MNILVAYDGSAGSRQALHSAAALAREANASVTVLRVPDPRVDAAEIQAERLSSAMQVAEQQAREDMQGALAEAGLEARLRVETVSRGEDIHEAIIRVAREESAAFIAISSRRAAGLAGALLGSITQAVLRNAKLPVLVVRPE